MSRAAAHFSQHIAITHRIYQLEDHLLQRYVDINLLYDEHYELNIDITSTSRPTTKLMTEGSRLNEI
jgi:hypothetical protein